MQSYSAKVGIKAGTSVHACISPKKAKLPADERSPITPESISYQESLHYLSAMGAPIISHANFSNFSSNNNSPVRIRYPNPLSA